MEDGVKQEKSTGYIPPISTAKGRGSALVKSTGGKKASPVLKNAPTRGASSTSAVALSASKILALQVLLGDFKALKLEMPMSWQASSNGKIYWCAELPGHKLAIIDGKLLVDHEPVENALAKLLAAQK